MKVGISSLKRILWGKSIINKLKQDILFCFILIVEIIILFGLLIKAFIGGASSIAMTGEAFFDNIGDYNTIMADGQEIVFHGLPTNDRDPLEPGIKVYSYEFPLRSGAYTVTVNYKSCGGEPMEYVLDANGCLGIRSILKESTPKFEPIFLDDQHEQVSGRVYIPSFSSVSDLQLYINYYGSGELRVDSILINENRVFRFMQVLGFIICFSVFNAVYYLLFSPIYKFSRFDFLSKGKDRTILIYIATIGFASIPLFIDYLYIGHDLIFHLNRIGAIANAMKYHKLPIRIQSDLLNGFGYNIPLFYCDLFLYPAGFLYGYCFLPMRTCYQIYIIVLNAVTAYTSYRCFKKMFSDTSAAAIGMVLYTLCVYRLVDIYLRSSLGEFTALTFYPLVLEGAYSIISEEEITIDDWIPLSFGMAGIVQCHFMSTIIVLFFLVIFLIIEIRKINVKRIISMIKASLLAMTLSVWFWLPLLQSLKELKPIVTDISLRIQYTGLYLVQLFELLPGGWGLSNEGTTGDMPLGLGGGVLLGNILIILYLLSRNRRTSIVIDKKKDRLLSISFAMGALAVWMSTFYFPRDLIARMLIGRFDFIRSLWEVIELVWRNLAVASLLLNVSIVAFLLIVRETKKSVFYVLIIAIVSLTVLSDLSFFRSFTYECQQYSYIELNNDQTAFVDRSSDFDMVWGMNRKIKDDTVLSQDNEMEIISYEKDGADRVLRCINRGNDSEVIVPLFDYVHYHAYDEKTGEEFDTFRSDNNARLAINVPSGFNSSIRIRYESPKLWHFAELISIISYLSIFIIYIYRRRMNRKGLSE